VRGPVSRFELNPNYRSLETDPYVAVFWAAVITEFINGAVTESTRPGKPNAWRVFTFESATQQIGD
jgi:hypothetical protein